jgi:hypothetical protein
VSREENPEMTALPDMTDIEMAASDAAADALSLPHGNREEAEALAQNAAYRAARKSGASPLAAAVLSQKVVAEMLGGWEAMGRLILN